MKNFRSQSRRFMPCGTLFAAMTLASVASAAPSAATAPEDLSAADWSSIRAAYVVARHTFEPLDDGWRARNPGQRWTTHFDGRGFLATPDHGEWQWGLELRSYGRTVQQPVGGAEEVVADGQALTYRRGGLKEWWINDPRGLEHGFIVAERPEDGETGAPLTFRLATVGGLIPRVESDGRGVAFEKLAGVSALTYGGLKVWDAEGTVLPSRFEAGGGEMLHLIVDDREAVYPITIDPVAQQAYLKAGNTGAGDFFGTSVAIDGDTVVVGATGEASNQAGPTNGSGGSADNSLSLAGAAYVFVRSGSTWTQQAYLKAANPDASDQFGQSVSISGDTIVVGAIGESSNQTGVTSGTGASADDSAMNAGAAYVFIRTGSTWTQQAYLKAGNTSATDQFGKSVAVAGDTIVVGAHQEDSNQIGVTNGSGASGDDSAGNAGAAYVFTRSGGNWSQQAYLKAGNTGGSDQFGTFVAVSGDTVAVGAPGEDANQTGVTNGTGGSADNTAAESGAVYVFLRSGVNWSQQAYLKAGNTGTSDQFGLSVAISGDSIVVGAPGEDSNQTGVTNETGGSSDNTANASGAAYVFTRSGGNWSQQAYLKAGNTGGGDLFGHSVSISGDTVAVGAYLEGSNQSGVTNGPGGSSDNSAANAGAGYVFTRAGTDWSQLAYLKAGNAAANDQFGYSVSTSGETVAVGAFWEFSNQTGVTNGTGGSADNSAPLSGAAYVFDLDASAPPRITLSKPRFKATPVKKRGRPQNVIVSNVGGSSATGLSASLSGGAKRDFKLARLSSAPLPPSARRTIKITFAPKKKGTRRATLTVRSNAPPAATALVGKAR